MSSRNPRLAAPRLLDLYCGGGGASMGYYRAGLEVVGVDIKPQPNYPFEFIKADALTVSLDGFDAFHASPPCQAYTTMSNRWRGAGGKADHSELIDATRSLLTATGLPYVIENVPGAQEAMKATLSLHGGMFGLGVHRPRLFESNVLILEPEAGPVLDPVGVYGKAPDGRLLFRRKDGSEQHAATSVSQGGVAMGIDWMTWDELREAIPPAYTEFIGRQLLAHLEIAA